MSTPVLPPASASSEFEVLLGELTVLVDKLSSLEPSTVQVAALGSAMKALEAQPDRLSGVGSEWALTFAQSGGPEDAGASSLAHWMRRENCAPPAMSRGDGSSPPTRCSHYRPRVLLCRRAGSGSRTWT